MMVRSISLQKPARHVRWFLYTVLISLLLGLLPTFGCRPKGEETINAGGQVITASIEQAKHAIARRDEPVLTQMLATAGVCLEKAADQSKEGNTSRASVFEQAALTCYLDARLVADTISRKRPLVLAGVEGFGTFLTRPWDFSHPWEVLGPAEGTLTIEKRLMLQFAASSELKDEQMDVLTAFPPGTIQYLNLGDASQISDAAVGSIGQMKGLLDLSLFNTHVSDHGLASLASLPYLRQVNLMGTKVTSEGIIALVAMLPGITELALEDSQAVDKTMWALRQCTRLERLICKRGQVTDVGLSHLDSLQTLRCLWIGGRQITDYSVSLLTRHTDMEEIVLMNTSITESGKQALQLKLPNCRVSSNE